MPERCLAVHEVALFREVLSARAAAGRSRCSFHAVRFAYGAAVQVLYLLLFTLCDLHKTMAIGLNKAILQRWGREGF